MGSDHEQKGQHDADEYQDEVDAGCFGEEGGEVRPLQLVAVQENHSFFSFKF